MKKPTQKRAPRIPLQKPSLEEFNVYNTVVHKKFEEVRLIHYWELAQHYHVVLNPAYQRPYVWKLPQAKAFVQACLQGRQVTGIEATRNGGVSASFIIIDGKQRLTSLRMYLDNKFAVDFTDPRTGEIKPFFYRDLEAAGLGYKFTEIKIHINIYAPLSVKEQSIVFLCVNAQAKITNEERIYGPYFLAQSIFKIMYQKVMVDTGLSYFLKPAEQKQYRLKEIVFMHSVVSLFVSPENLTDFKASTNISSLCSSRCERGELLKTATIVHNLADQLVKIEEKERNPQEGIKYGCKYHHIKKLGLDEIMKRLKETAAVLAKVYTDGTIYSEKNGQKVGTFDTSFTAHLLALLTFANAEAPDILSVIERYKVDFFKMVVLASNTQIKVERINHNSGSAKVFNRKAGIMATHIKAFLKAAGRPLNKRLEHYIQAKLTIDRATAEIEKHNQVIRQLALDI